MTNKDLLYSTGHYTQYLVITYYGKNLKMKKKLTFLATLLVAFTLHAQTVAVLGFESDDFCIEDRTGTMSDLLTDELVGLPHITVVERKHIDQVVGEMKFQAKPYTDPATAKQLGKMIGADAVIIGSAEKYIYRAGHAWYVMA